MKSNILKFSSLILLGMSSPVFAAVGTINFSGAVNSTTCSGSVTGGTSGSSTESTVILPEVLVGDLNAPGDTAGEKTFSISLTDGSGGPCSITTAGTATYAVPFFEFDANKVNANGRLINSAIGGAENVDIQILDGSSNPINIVGDYTDQKNNIVVAADKMNYLYKARYYATGSSSVGAVSSNISYNIFYK